MTAFLDVLLRGLALVSQAVAVGGVLFVLIVLRPGSGPSREGAPSASRSLTLVAAAAILLALAQTGSLLLHLAALVDEGAWPVGAALGTTYFRVGALRIGGALALAVVCGRVRLASAARGPQVVLLAAALVLAGASAWHSHAAARLEGRAALLGLDAAHQFGASVWVGGLAHLVAAAFRRDRSPWSALVLKRFSALALAAVGLLVAAGVGLAVTYVDGVPGLLGTSYGVMVLAKAAMLSGLLALGAMNFLTVRRLAPDQGLPLTRVRRFVEVELGLGITVLFAAASLTSLPPAVDMTAGRASLEEVATRFTPRWPRWSSPAIETMPIGDREAPRTDEDRAWSEYNHHVSGLFVLGMGLLALAHGLGGARSARHWPLLFIGLAAFMMVRNDPGSWPLGPEGFWEGFAHVAVVQHRFFVLLVVGFGLFEWMVRTGRLRSPACALVFPLLCVVGGALLLTHSHAMLNAKQEFLTEVTHAPLGLLALVIGWGRWLELRLPPPGERLPGRLWAVAFTLIGALLLLYRES
jgi:putative copper resistance protein D